MFDNALAFRHVLCNKRARPTTVSFISSNSRPHMKLIRLLAAIAVCTSSLNAQIVTISSATLGTVTDGSTSKTYAGLDVSGTSMTAAVAPGDAGVFRSGPGSFPGLWFGSNNASSTYTFTFSSAVKFFEFYFTAQSTVAGRYSEVLNAFVTNGGSPSYTFTNVGGAAWDGASITSNGEGSSILGITAAAGQSFTTIRFSHIQTGAPVGSVIERMRYELAGSDAVVPEPQTYLLLGSGLVALAGIARKRKSAAV